MTQEITLQALATEARGYFERKERKEGESFWVTKDNAPEWITAMSREAHGDMLPDDLRYDFIIEALDALEENENADDIELEADIYTHDLTAWLHSRVDRYAYVDDAISEYGWSDKRGIIEALQLGQIAEKQEVLGSVRSFLENRLKELSENE